MRRFLTLLLLAAGLSAQDDDAARLSQSRRWDVHVLFVERAGPGAIPVFVNTGCLRLAFSEGGGEDVTTVESRVGVLTGVKEVSLSRQPVGVGGTGFNLTASFAYESRHSNGSMSGSWVDPHGHVQDNLGSGGRGVRHDGRRGARFALILPAPDSTGGPVCLEPGECGEILAAIAIRQARERADDSAALGVLCRLPLARLLDLRTRVDLIAALQGALPKNVEESGSHMTRFLNGLQIFAQDGRQMETALRSWVRLLAGDYEMLDAGHEVWAMDWDWSRTLAVAYAQVEDRVMKGRIGWEAVRPPQEDGNRPRMAALVPTFASAVEKGDALLPGTESEVAERRVWLFGLAAEADVRWPLAVIGAGLAGMLGLSWLVRRAGRRLLF